MTDSTSQSLPHLVATLRERVEELRRAGDPDAFLAAARDAADEIENRVGVHWNDEERQALTAVKRFTYNAAADGWPGWSVTAKPSDTRTLVLALELAQRSVRLVRKLALGPLQEGTGTWLCGAFDLALGRYSEASSAFADAQRLCIEAKAPGMALLTEGYIAIVAQVTGHEVTAGAPDLNQIMSRIAAGGFEDGPEWIEQLRIASKVFAR